MNILFMSEMLTLPEGAGGLFDFNATLPLMAIQFSLFTVVLTFVFYKPAALYSFFRFSELLTQDIVVTINVGPHIVGGLNGYIEARGRAHRAEILDRMRTLYLSKGKHVRIIKKMLDLELQRETARELKYLSDYSREAEFMCGLWERGRPPSREVRAIRNLIENKVIGGAIQKFMNINRVDEWVEWEKWTSY